LDEEEEFRAKTAVAAANRETRRTMHQPVHIPPTVRGKRSILVMNNS